MAWVLVVREGPEKDRFISKDELRYIHASLKHNENKKISYPWKAIFTSTAVYAICVSHFSENWGFYTLLTQLPTFLKGTLHIHLFIRLANNFYLFYFDFLRLCRLIFIKTIKIKPLHTAIRSIHCARKMAANKTI